MFTVATACISNSYFLEDWLYTVATSKEKRIWKQETKTCCFNDLVA